MITPEELLYSESHEWVKLLDDGTALVGITDFAQDELGDIVFVNLPMEGDPVVAGEAFGDVESVKAVSDLVSPIGGTVAAVNEELLDAPQLINEGAYDAWMIKVESVTGDDQLMSAAEYEAFIASQED
ncbi:MAG: glycine cleavage system protein GcvH [Ruminococcaceae bacterium]|nr:glycine cleavage system protein GcvH [Oscillospiraceae bacterium]